MRAVAERRGPEAVAFAVATPSGTAMSDGFPWVNRLIRLFGSPNMMWGEELCAWHRDYVTPTRSVPTSARRTSRAPDACCCGPKSCSSATASIAIFPGCDAMRARAKLNATLAPDVIWAQFGWPEASYNDLIDPDAAGPISGTVALRSHLCEVLKDGG
jgi:hypothetical protein